MRKLTVTVADEQGVVLEQQTIEVRDGVYELYIQEVLPNSAILQHGHTIEIGTGGTVWKDE